MKFIHVIYICCTWSYRIVKRFPAPTHSGGIVYLILGVEDQPVWRMFLSSKPIFFLFCCSKRGLSKFRAKRGLVGLGLKNIVVIGF